MLEIPVTQNPGIPEQRGRGFKKSHYACWSLLVTAAEMNSPHVGLTSEENEFSFT